MINNALFLLDKWNIRNEGKTRIQIEIKKFNDNVKPKTFLKQFKSYIKSFENVYKIFGYIYYKNEKDVHGVIIDTTDDKIYFKIKEFLNYNFSEELPKKKRRQSRQK